MSESECGHWWCKEECIGPLRKHSLAAGVMDAEEIMAAKANDWKPAEFVEKKYGVTVDPYEYSDDGDLRAALAAARNDNAAQSRAFQAEQSKQARQPDDGPLATEGTVEAEAGTEATEELAAAALTAAETLRVEASDATASEYLREEHGVRAEQFVDEQTLVAAVQAERGGSP